MLTPSFSPTATERVLPRLALDFTTAALDARVAFTRALNTATRFNSSGLIEIVNADLPRFDYDPVTRVCRGILIEETRSNTVTNSGNISNASWTKSNTTIGTAVTAPDGTATGYKLVEDTANSTHYASAPATFTAGQTYAISCFAKTAGDNRRITFGGAGIGGASEYPIFDVDAGTVYTAATTNVVKSATITPVGNGWYRCAAVVTAGGAAAVQILITTATTNTTGAGQTYAGNGTAGVYVVGGQVELGTYATSYIPTTTTSLTRNNDVASLSGANFSGWWQATRGGMLVRARQSVITGIRPLAHLSDGTANNLIALRGNAANPELYIKATTDQAQIDAGTLAANASYGMAGAWNTNDCAAVFNGGAAVTDTSATIPTVDRMLIGSDGTNYLNGWIEKVAFWPQRPTNAEIQAFSK